MEQDSEVIDKDQRTFVFPETPKKKPRGLWIFLGILIALILGAALFHFADSGWRKSDKPYVAVMYIEGEIGGAEYDFLGRVTDPHGWRLKELRKLAEDSQNKGLFFYVDSPGGAVYQSDELYLAIEEYKKLTGRPVYVYMGPYGASGAYYISTAADRIFANRNTWTGSIGVTIGTLFDVSGLLKKYGVQAYTFDSGEMKSAGNGWEELTEAQRSYFQGLVDEAYEQFVDVVACGRGLSRQEVRKLADGRIYTAKQAKALGLIDEIGSMDEAVSDMKTQYGLSDCEFQDVVYEYDDDWGLSDVISLLLGRSEGQAPSSLAKAQKNRELPLKYLFTMP